MVRSNAVISLGAAAILAVISGVPGRAASGPDSPHGFGNIPFGAKKDKALDLNAGNGRLVDNPDKTATLAYTTLIAGISFDVAQNFDPDGKAIDAKLTYQTREATNACIDRFNFVLSQLTLRYGKPRSPPALRREDAAPLRTDAYTVEFAFPDQAAIKAEVTTGYPLPQSSGAAGGAQGQAGQPAAAAGTTCGITLQYLPPGWIARF
jgi:hypothetical protein